MQTRSKTFAVAVLAAVGLITYVITVSNRLNAVFADEAGSETSIARTGVVLPLPPAPFKGQIAVRAKDSVPDFPQPVQAPKGAPNILLVLLDDVGYGAASTFGGPCNTPTLTPARRTRVEVQPFPYHGALQPHAGRTPDRPQSPLRPYRLHHGSRHGLSRVRHVNGPRHGHGRRNPEAVGLRHRLVWQESQRAGLGNQPGRTVRPLADGSRVRPFLRLHRRRHEPMAAERHRRNQAN